MTYKNNDIDLITNIVDKIILENPEKLLQIKKNPKMIGWFVGQAMKKTNGKIHPQICNELFLDKLDINISQTSKENQNEN